MSPMDCGKDKYFGKTRICCDNCDAGKYMTAECDSTQQTQCAECGYGSYMDTKNNLSACHPCKNCYPINNQRNMKDCTAQENTVCECVPGFYCNNDECDHCQPARLCPPGQGVKVQASRTNDTICTLCDNGTYSNVTDFHSTCKTHTRCEDIGRVLKNPGTAKTDAICGDFKTHCHWMLPAAMWSGLVVTALILLCLFIWRTKSRSYRAASSPVPVFQVDIIPAVPEYPPDLPLPSTEINNHCQESLKKDTCHVPLIKPDDSVTVSYYTQDSLDRDNHPITPLKASVSFAESYNLKGSSGYSTSLFLRSHSEPQEDEYCGT